MEFTEQELEDYLCETGTIIVNEKKVNILDRQVNIGYYRIDLIGEDSEGNIYVFELKKYIIDGNALSQLLCYMWYIKSYIKADDKYNKKKVYGVLIGSEITDYVSRGINILKGIYYIQSIPSFVLFGENKKYLTKAGNKDNLFIVLNGNQNE